MGEQAADGSPGSPGKPATQAYDTDIEGATRATHLRRALGRAHAVFEAVPVTSLAAFRDLMAAEASVTLAFIRQDEDLERIGTEHQATFSFKLSELLRDEFQGSSSEGILLRRDRPLVGGRAYLAVIDARARQAARAYFTAWHEIAHLLVGLPLDDALHRVYGHRNSVERLVDDVAAQLAFFAPIFLPIVEQEASLDAVLSFDTIERIRERATPEASLYATTMAVVPLLDRPCCFIVVHRDENDGVLVVHRTTHGSVSFLGFQIRENLRVPVSSILNRVFGTGRPEGSLAKENQGWWSGVDGPLLDLSFYVAAVSRGNLVYGLLQPCPIEKEERTSSRQ